jgi:CopG antitoxin of type II toxin-antitoxin system
MLRSETKELQEFKSVEEFVDFFDNNDISEYLEDMPDVEFEINPNLRELILVGIEAKLFERLRVIAKAQNIKVEEFINQWLEKKLVETEEA